MPKQSLLRLALNEWRALKKDPDPEILLAQDQEIQALMSRFQAGPPTGLAVQELEGLVRAAVFKSANALVGWLLQQAVDRIDTAYQPKAGEQYKGRIRRQSQGMFGQFPLERDYYYHPGKKEGHYPADAALGLEGSCTPALARLICLEGADQSSYQKAELHLAETGGIHVQARQVQRLVQQVGAAAQKWQEREARPGGQAAPILYVSADGTGVPMRKEELAGRKGKQPDGSAKTRQAYLGCVFTQHKPSIKPIKRAIQCATTNRRRMFQALPASTSLAPFYGRMRCGAAWRWRRRSCC